MNSISKLRFDAIAGYVRNPILFVISEELEWYEAGSGKVLGVLFLDRTDKDFGACVLGRDKRKRFRAVSVIHSLPSAKKARQQLRVEMAKCLKLKAEEFYQGDEKGEPLNFFKPVVANEKLNRSFREISIRRKHPGRDLLAEMMNWYEDVDGNFVEQFQTTGLMREFGSFIFMQRLLKWVTRSTALIPHLTFCALEFLANSSSKQPR